MYRTVSSALHNNNVLVCRENQLLVNNITYNNKMKPMNDMTCVRPSIPICAAANLVY